MSKRLYYENVEIGMKITPLQKVATTQMLVVWAGAVGDDNPLHFDGNYAKEQGIDDIIIQGALKRAWLCQLMTDWIGEEGELKKISCQYRGVDFPRKMKTMFAPHEGETWRCEGIVTKKYFKENKHFIQCEIWIVNGKGEKTTRGEALVTLPARNITGR
jgi:acyl dehydratase